MKQPSLIDAEKLYDWLYGNGYHEICEEIRLREGAGSFSPTPPVQPDTHKINLGDEVRHKQYKKRGDAIQISDTSAYVRWETGQRSWYSFENLEVITDEQR